MRTAKQETQTKGAILVSENGRCDAFSSKRIAVEIARKLHSVGGIFCGPSFARAEDMKEASSVDGNTLIWSLTSLIIALVLGAMAYALVIGIDNLPHIGV